MKKRLMACLLAVCMFTTVLAPVNGAFATEVIEETAAPTAVPTEKPTEAPTAVPTEEPTEAPTAAPTEEPTKAPTAAPATEAPATEAPATEEDVMTVAEEEPTEAPTEKPTEAPATEVPATEVPATEAPVTEAPATETPVTEAPATEAPATEAPATEAPATEVPETEAPATETPSAEPTVDATEGATTEPTIEPTPEGSVEPSMEPSVSPGIEPTVPAPATELSIAAAANVAYAFANDDTVSAKVRVSGGIAPYSITLKVNGANVQSAEIVEAGEYSMSYAPTEFGVHKFEISVTDALDVSKACGFEVPVAVREEEHESDWKRDFRDVELTGDWREDLIAIAKTQLGYEESERNFRINDEGEKQGYTRYGDWYGSSYAEWCAMFISFCLNYAEIPADGFPREANCQNWKELLQQKGAYEEDEHEYEPKPGDLIFINWQHDYENTYKLDNKPQHIGIVEKVTDDKVHTIEGNSLGGGVRRQEYDRDSIVIVGYGNTEKLMDRAGKLEGAEIECNVVGAKAFTKGESINMRSDATTSSDVVVKIEEANSEMTVLGAKQTGEMIWYQVQYGEYTGYIRGDLIEIQENLTPVEPQATEEPAATAEPTATVEPTAEPEVTVDPEVTAEPEATATPEATIEPEETMGVPVDATIEPTVEATPAPTEESTVIIGVTVTENVNIREQPTTDSERVTYIPAAGEEVLIAGSGEVNGELWYAVYYGEYKGFIRADLIAVQEATAEPTVEPTAEPSVETTVEPTAEPEIVCECADAEGNRVCAEDCACECHTEDLPIVEDELLCVCTDTEGNRVCAEDCVCECHVVEEPAVGCVCTDEAGNRVCAEDCACECHVVEEPAVGCVCTDEAGNRVCAEDCACECHVVEEPAVECVCTDEAGNRVCAEDCACECHVVEEPAVGCVCTDEAGNRVCAEDCACECHIVEAPVCVCYDAEGNAICAEDCVCECHVPVIEEPTVIEYKPWETGVVETVMSYAVEGAVSYSWQRGMVNENGEMVWEEIASTEETETLLATGMDDLKYSYRCVATMEDGTQVISNEITLIDAELVQWMNEGEVTEEMLTRAMNASSLESLMVEGGQLIHVRTGKVLADVDTENGAVFDRQYEVIVGYIKKETMELVPAVEPEPVPDEE